MTRPRSQRALRDRDSPGVMRVNLADVCGSGTGDACVALDRQHLHGVVLFPLPISPSNFWCQWFVTLLKNSFVELVVKREVG